MRTSRLVGIKAIWELSLQLAKAEFKLRNEGSYLGIVWYLLSPILTCGILYFIFANKLGGTIPYYPVYLFLGVILFNIFQTTTIESAKSILKEYHHIIKSIHFPREALVLSILLKNIFSHVFEIILLAALLLYMNISLLVLIYYIPILILFALFIYGTSLLISALTVYFVDLDNIWNFAVRIIWFGTPIFYVIEDHIGLLYLNLINPLYYFITLARDLIIYQQISSVIILLGSIGFSFGFLVVGLMTFKRLKRNFAQLI